MLSCSIWFSAPSFWMGGGPESRCVVRVYGADGAVRRRTEKYIFLVLDTHVRADSRLVTSNISLCERKQYPINLTFYILLKNSAMV